MQQAHIETGHAVTVIIYLAADTTFRGEFPPDTPVREVAARAALEHGINDLLLLEDLERHVVLEAEDTLRGAGYEREAHFHRHGHPHEELDPEPPHGRPKVQVTYTGSGETKTFRATWATSLQHVWDEAYDKLKEVRKDGDEFRCAHKDGPSLMGRLEETLEQLYAQDVCTDHKFKIRTPTGGA